MMPLAVTLSGFVATNFLGILAGEIEKGKAKKSSAYSMRSVNKILRLRVTCHNINMSRNIYTGDDKDVFAVMKEIKSTYSLKL